LDRLPHHSHIVQIAGESYRLKDKRKVGQVKIRISRTVDGSAPARARREHLGLTQAEVAKRLK